MIEEINECPPGKFPRIGKWMITTSGKPANWFFHLHDGKELREPINLVFVDRQASSGEDAKNRLLHAMRRAGYPGRRGHSSGYMGRIDDKTYSQLPEENGHSFSNRPYFVPNNHGRIFGPAPFNDSYLFVGAFSREGIAPFARVKHTYISFRIARDHLVKRLRSRTIYQPLCKLNLDNTIVNSATLTTGDHDGYAMVLQADS